MKKIIAFFVNIWIFLFGKREKVEKEKVIDKIFHRPSGPTVPAHNNRKVRKGRYVQYINTGEGRERAIYHSSK